jgi:uncharacterized protein YyaL (SSP411 family)
MAHESFEDPQTAAVMNELFVNVKVDREERPDVDAVYMAATQAMTGHGGWPMTVFLTPDGRPFYCGTYFPSQPRHGMPAFTQVCRAIEDAWQNRRDAVAGQADELTTAVARSSLVGDRAGRDLDGAAVLQAAYAALRAAHDDDWGGFGHAPKFPQTMSLELLLRAHAHNGDEDTLRRARTSLDAMAAGGMYDHLGGGFARYSVDSQWLVPHFEKMLYDQALLARVYAHAWLVTDDPGYAQVVDETVEYVLRDLRHAEGGFFAAEDADSEGEEGKFYLWTLDEVRAAGADAAVDWYGVTAGGNFEGRNILNRIAHRGQLVRPAEVDAARQRLFDVREGRVRPGLDDKVLTEWNGLLLATLAEAAAVRGRADWLAAAVANADFLLGALRRPDGRWLRSWQADADPPARTLAFAADYGALLDGFTRLAEATGEARWIGEATAVADGLLDLFWDGERGGLFTTGRDGEALIARPKDVLDDATPSATSLAALGLLRVAALTGHATYEEHALDLIRSVGPVAGQHPTAFAHLLSAVDFTTSGATEIVVAGDRPDLLAVVRQGYRPNAVLAWGERYDSPLWEGRDGGRAYVCRRFTCGLPAMSPDDLRTQLAGTVRAR